MLCYLLAAYYILVMLLCKYYWFCLQIQTHLVMIWSPTWQISFFLKSIYLIYLYKYIYICIYINTCIYIYIYIYINIYIYLMLMCMLLDICILYYEGKDVVRNEMWEMWRVRERAKLGSCKSFRLILQLLEAAKNNKERRF